MIRLINKLKYQALALVFALSAIGQAQAEAIGSVFLSFGDNHAINAQGEQRPLKRADDLFVDDRLFTSENGRLQVRFIDGSRLALKPSTEFAVADFEFKPEEEGGSKAIFQLLKGGMRTLTGQIGKREDDQYQVDAVVATIGIRGTYYGVEFTEQGLYIETIEGVIVVTTPKGEFEVAAGQAVLVNSETGDVIFVPYTGQTAQGRLIAGRFEGSDSKTDGAADGENQDYWERWTGTDIAIEEFEPGEPGPAGVLSGVVDPVTSFTNLANKSGTYTYNFAGTTLATPTATFRLNSVTQTYEFLTSSLMTVDWNSQSITDVLINLLDGESTLGIEEISATTLDTILNGGGVPVTDSDDWTGTMGVQFLGVNADAAAINLQLNNGEDVLTGSAILE